MIWQAVVVVGVAAAAIAWFRLVPSEFCAPPVDDSVSANQVRQLGGDDFALWERQFATVHRVNPRAWRDLIGPAQPSRDVEDGRS